MAAAITGRVGDPTLDPLEAARAIAGMAREPR
jgi:hypothetical protein